jgi:hypothetical protein
MKLKNRLERIESAIECNIPLSLRIATVSNAGAVPAVEAEYLAKYGTTKGLRIVIFNMPEPDLPPADSVDETM